MNLVEVDVVGLQPLEESSTAARMPSGVRSPPLRIHGLRAGPATLLASTTRSRGCFFSQVPMMRSVLPYVSARGLTGYISAVSMKLMPRENA
jgi:hypothetical protein